MTQGDVVAWNNRSDTNRCLVVLFSTRVVIFEHTCTGEIIEPQTKWHTQTHTHIHTLWKTHPLQFSHSSSFPPSLSLSRDNVSSSWIWAASPSLSFCFSFFLSLLYTQTLLLVYLSLSLWMWRGVWWEGRSRGDFIWLLNCCVSQSSEPSVFNFKHTHTQTQSYTHTQAHQRSTGITAPLDGSEPTPANTIWTHTNTHTLAQREKGRREVKRKKGERRTRGVFWLHYRITLPKSLDDGEEQDNTKPLEGNLEGRYSVKFVDVSTWLDCSIKSFSQERFSRGQGKKSFCVSS